LRDYNRELFRIREKALSTVDSTSTSREDKIRIRRRKILNLIVGYTAIGGISLADISRIIDIDRKYLIKHLQSLQIDGLVRRGKGKHGRYLATKYIPSDTYLSAEVFAKLFVAYVLRPNDDDIAQVYSPYIESRSLDQYQNYGLSLERIMFDFSNAIGAFITYVLIQSMNQVNNIITNVQDTKEKDLVIQKWVSDVISELQAYLLPLFKDCIQNSILTIDRCKKDGIGESILNYVYLEPKYIFDNSIIADLTSAFSNAYPDLYRTLEKVRKKWPKIVQQTNDNITYLSMSHEIQRKCKHEYKECSIPVGEGRIPTITRPGFHCSKCHRTVNKDNKRYRSLRY